MTSQFDDDLARGARFDQGMRAADFSDRKTPIVEPIVEKRIQFPRFGKVWCLLKYLSVMCAAFAGKQRKQSKHAGVGENPF
jgi:hypothetical protein